MKINDLKAKNRALRKNVNEQIIINGNLKRDNRKLKEEVKLIKTTQGWFSYKTKNIYQRISKKF
jgi:FtsZ-binding cell division protein ZapB